MINIDHKDEKNSLYKCHFCQENINVYGIEQHFVTFHKFQNSFESEYVCEFCDDFEEFHSQTNLFQHIQNSHNILNDEEIQSESIANVDTLEEGKSRFLQLIVNFKSKDDVFNLLQWIKSNDTNTFITNHQGIENEYLVVKDNVSKMSEEYEEKSLLEDIVNAESNSEDDLNQETDVILIQEDISTFNITNHQGEENQLLVVEENTSKTTEEDARNFFHEDMDNADSDSEADLEQEMDVILTQKDINTFMNKQQEIENPYVVVEENISKTTEEDAENILHKDMNNAELDSEEDLLTQTKIVAGHENLDDETVNEDVYQNKDFDKNHKCESCDKSFKSRKNLNMHIHTVHEGQKDYKCESCSKSFTQGHNLKNHIQKIHEVGNYNKCEYCSKSFSTPQYLKLHIRVYHDGHGGQQCDSCGKIFLKLSVLEAHLHTVHDGYKDYKCESCDKSFKSRQNLNVHIHTVHKGQKDYKCESCGKSFSQGQNLKRHIQIIHKGNANKD